MRYSNTTIRRIWGKSDTILFIFAGAAAEFALNKAVDWLYFTGKLPSDPLGRLFSTVAYARHIIFASEQQANQSIDKMRQIHGNVETSRGASIPDWAYRDVLFMLIYYSIRSYEVLERKLSPLEKEDVVRVFLNVGERMQLKDLPQDHQSWIDMYQQHQYRDLQRSRFTVDLFRQYRRSLGAFRYFILIELQKLLINENVRQLLRFRRPLLIHPVLFLYRMLRKTGADKLVKALLLPDEYKQSVKSLDQPAT